MTCRRNCAAHTSRAFSGDPRRVVGMSSEPESHRVRDREVASPCLALGHADLDTDGAALDHILGESWWRWPDRQPGYSTTASRRPRRRPGLLLSSGIRSRFATTFVRANDRCSLRATSHPVARQARCRSLLDQRPGISRRPVTSSGSTRTLTLRGPLGQTFSSRRMSGTFSASMYSATPVTTTLQPAWVAGSP